ncbi:MAG: hypothetical protein AB1393_03405 [Candidatus Edwardsbacteria bacterium]
MSKIGTKINTDKRLSLLGLFTKRKTAQAILPAEKKCSEATKLYVLTVGFSEQKPARMLSSEKLIHRFTQSPAFGGITSGPPQKHKKSASEAYIIVPEGFQADFEPKFNKALLRILGIKECAFIAQKRAVSTSLTFVLSLQERTIREGFVFC